MSGVACDEDGTCSNEFLGMSLMCGNLLKWTNIFGGWQKRFFVLKDGSLSYFKSEYQTDCRGSVRLKSVKIDYSGHDNFRFSIMGTDLVWHLKADADSYKGWILSLTEHKANSESGYGSDVYVDRSVVTSLNSERSSVYKSENEAEGGDNLRQRFSQICVFRDLAVQQICLLQTRMEQLIDGTFIIDSNNSSSSRHINTRQDEHSGPASMLPQRIELQNSLEKTRSLSEHSLRDLETQPTPSFKIPSDYHQYLMSELRNDVSAFKSTTDGLLVNLNCYIDSMQRRDSVWRSKCIELQRKLDERETVVPSTVEITTEPEKVDDPPHQTEEIVDEKHITFLYPKENGETDHPYYHLVEKTTIAMKEHIKLDRQDLKNEEGWQCIHVEGEMHVFRREMEVNGRIVDPLKMEHIVQGVTAYEICSYFWSPDQRLDWDQTLEKLRVVDRIGSNNVICYQTHRRIWPSVQRDACILSQIASFQDDGRRGHHHHSKPVAGRHGDLKKHSTWIVVNQSVDHDDAPILSPNSFVRVHADVAMTCETFANDHAENRNDIYTRITYVASINPGGWAPSTAVRALSKREFPKFLSKFTAYVKEKTKDSPIKFDVQ